MQFRILDARGHTLHCGEDDHVDTLRLVKPLVAGEEGLLLRLSGGNSGLADFYGFGTGGSSRFHVSDAVDASLQDLDADGTAEVVAVYRLPDIDGGGEHHGPLLTVVYRWNGARYMEATQRFSAAARAKEYQAQIVRLEEGKTTPGNSSTGTQAQELKTLALTTTLVKALMMVSWMRMMVSWMRRSATWKTPRLPATARRREPGWKCMSPPAAGSCLRTCAKKKERSFSTAKNP